MAHAENKVPHHKGGKNRNSGKLPRIPIKDVSGRVPNSQDLCRGNKGVTTNSGGKAWKPPRNDLGGAHNRDCEPWLYSKPKRSKGRDEH